MTTDIPLGPKERAGSWWGAMAIGLAIGIAIELAPGFGIVLPSTGVLILLGAVAVALFLAGAIAWAVVTMRRFGTENNLAVSALGRGELAAARAVFGRWVSSGQYPIRAMARHNVGWTLMFEGRVEEAAAVLEDAAEHHRAGLTRLSVLPATRVEIGLCHALLGHLDVADAWCARAEEPVKALPNPKFPGLLALARAVIACRRGRAAEAMVALEHAWAEHEATLTGETLRVMRVVRAFACAAAEGPRSQGLVERVLGDMKPRYRGELAFLGGTWPEMAAFLAAHQLDG